MAIIVIGFCFVVGLFVYEAQMDSGSYPRSRGSLRYQRRKARQLGISAADLHVNARTGNEEIPEPIGTSHVSDLAWSLGLTASFLILWMAGWMVVPGDWIWGWGLLLYIGVCVLHNRRKRKYQNG